MQTGQSERPLSPGQMVLTPSWPPKTQHNVTQHSGEREREREGERERERGGLGGEWVDTQEYESLHL